MAEFPWLQFRTIIEDPEVQKAVDRLSKKPRFNDAWDALRWRLARDGQNLGQSITFRNRRFRLYKQDSDPLAKTPTITVVYSYELPESQEIFIHEIW